MTPSQFIAAVQDAGGRFYWEGTSLKVWAPRGVLSDELRAQWPAIKPALMAFIGQCRVAQRRWQAYLSAHTVPGTCSCCGGEVALWPWEDPTIALCLTCARAQIVAADETRAPAAPPPPPPLRPVPSSGRSHAPRGVHPDDVAELRPCSGGCGRQTFRAWACSACNQRHARIELSKGRSE